MSRPNQETINHLSAPLYTPYSEADFDGYHAAPLLLSGEFADEALVTRQKRIAKALVAAVHGELAPFAKERVRHFVADSITSRMQQREGLNGTSYNDRLYNTPHYDMVANFTNDEIDEVCERVRQGEGTPCENEMARRALGMSSVELANLTIIGNYRRDLEYPMWEDVGELVGKDVTPKPEEMYGLKLLSFDRDIRQHRHIGAMRIEMKRVLGQVEDGTTAKARTTAIINTSPSSGFDQGLIERFKRLSKPEQVAELPEFQRAIAWLISSEAPEGIVLSRNETVYAENEIMRRAISQRRLFVRPTPLVAPVVAHGGGRRGSIESILELQAIDQSGWLNV